MTNSQFDKYVGRKVLVKETQETIKIGGKDYDHINYEIETGDTVVAEIQKEYPKVRVWLPNTMGTMDYRLDRLNVHIEKQTDGSFVVTRMNFG